MHLRAYLYEEDVTPPVDYIMRLRSISNIRILWELPGGVLAIEMDWRGDEDSAYDFYQRYLGYRVVVVDDFLGRPVAEGWIFGVAIAPFGCRLLCKGSWFRHFDRFDDTVYNLTDTTTEIIQATITNFVTFLNGDQSNIDDTGFALDVSGTWDLSTHGLYPGDLIVKVAAMSNSDANQWNYWVMSSPFKRIGLRRPIAYFKEQIDDGTFNWQINKRDIGGTGLTQERSIEELANRVLVIYRNIDGGTQGITAWATDTDSQTAFWTRDIIMTGGEMVPDGAEQYRDLILEKHKDPFLTRSMTITSPYIYDNEKQKWPLWYVIKNGGGYLRINNLYPESLLFDESMDRKRIGQIMTAEYDDSSYSLRVSLDTTDESADVILSQNSLL